MQDVALDACCLINLCAAGKIFETESRALPARRGASAPKPAVKRTKLSLVNYPLSIAVDNPCI